MRGYFLCVHGIMLGILISDSKSMENFTGSENAPKSESTERDKINEMAMEYVKNAYAEVLSEEKGVETSFNSRGREYSIACVEDCMVAQAQLEVKIAKNVLENILKENDYYKELAAARLLEMLQAKEKYVTKFAGVRQSYSNLDMTEEFTDLKSFVDKGNEKLDEIKGKAT